MLQKVLLVAYALAINCFAFILCMLLQFKLVTAPSVLLNIKRTAETFITLSL